MSKEQLVDELKRNGAQLRRLWELGKGEFLRKSNMVQQPLTVKDVPLGQLFRLTGDNRLFVRGDLIRDSDHSVGIPKLWDGKIPVSQIGNLENNIPIFSPFPIDTYQLDENLEIELC